MLSNHKWYHIELDIIMSALMALSTPEKWVSCSLEQKGTWQKLTLMMTDEEKKNNRLPCRFCRLAEGSNCQSQRRSKARPVAAAGVDWIDFCWIKNCSILIRMWSGSGIEWIQMQSRIEFHVSVSSGSPTRMNYYSVELGPTAKSGRVEWRRWRQKVKNV